MVHWATVISVCNDNTCSSCSGRQGLNNLNCPLVYLLPVGILTYIRINVVSLALQSHLGACPIKFALYLCIKHHHVQNIFCDWYKKSCSLWPSFEKEFYRERKTWSVWYLKACCCCLYLLLFACPRLVDINAGKIFDNFLWPFGVCCLPYSTEVGPCLNKFVRKYTKWQFALTSTKLWNHMRTTFIGTSRWKIKEIIINC